MERRTNWQLHVDEWLQSGLSQKEYCRRCGIAVASFGYWRRKLKRNESSKPRFYPLLVSTGMDNETSDHANCGLRVVLGRFAIDIGDQFSPTVLQWLVTTLGQLQ